MKLAIPAALLSLILALPRAQSHEKVLFFDDFSASSLDRSKWNVIVTGRTVNEEQQAYVDTPDTIAVENGALAISRDFARVSRRQRDDRSTSSRAVSTPAARSSSQARGEALLRTPAVHSRHNRGR
jgi:hypothetical protein